MFTVPIVSTDLRHDETIVQAARALDCLKVTIDSVFDRIDGRIATNVQKLANLGARISSAEERIRSFQGVKTAIKIYAPSRFPASHVFEDLPATFDICNEPLKPMPAEEPERLIRLPTKLTAKESAEAMQNKLVFYHVRDEVPDTAVRSVCSPISEHIAAAHARLNRHGNSLGKPPEHLLSAASLLRFNSEELAYSSCAADEQSSKAKEAWRRAKMHRNQRQETGAVQRKQHYNLEPAPHSIAHGHHMRATRSGELRYTPRMNEAPSFELPMDLPTLEGIATDIQFEASADMYSNITPSSPATALPVIDIATQPIAVESELKPKEIKAPAPKKRTAPQPPAAEAVAPAIAVTTTPPPPPPPPPARAPAIQPSSPPSTSSGDDTRSALMDAIRKAGGTRGGGLRSAAAAPLDVTDVNKQVNKRESKQPTGGNLMADLHNKLLMRRKGISGINSDASINSTSSNFNMNMEDTNVNVRRKKDTSMGSSVMDRLSALIPPPPPKTKVEEQKQQQKQRNQHSDDNTEEDDDWN